MRFTFLAVSLFAASVSAQDIGVGTAFPNAPKRFPISEDGMVIYSTNANSSARAASDWKFVGLVTGTNWSISNTTMNPSQYGVESWREVYDIDFSTNHGLPTVYSDWFISMQIIEVRNGDFSPPLDSTGYIVQPIDSNGVGKNVTALGSRVLWTGTEDTPTLYEHNQDVNYAVTLEGPNEWVILREYTRLINELPSGKILDSVAELSDSRGWANFSDGAYTFGYGDPITWPSTPTVPNGVATGASESGVYLTGTLSTGSFVLKNSQLKVIVEPGLELLDVNDDGYAVGKYTRPSDGKIFPVVWDYVNETLDILTDHENHWLGSVIDLGFGIYENSSGQKGPFSMQWYYNDAPEICPADLNDDGSLNFFDLSIFLSMYGEGSAGADFTDDAFLNFFDVSAFLAAYNAGCAGYSAPDPLP
jgi:hypothetical protein